MLPAAPSYILRLLYLFGVPSHAWALPAKWGSATFILKVDGGGGDIWHMSHPRVATNSSIVWKLYGVLTRRCPVCSIKLLVRLSSNRCGLLRLSALLYLWMDLTLYQGYIMVRELPHAIGPITVAGPGIRAAVDLSSRAR